MWSSGFFLPIIRRQGNEDRIILPGSDETARVFGTTWMEQSVQLCKVFDHLVSLAVYPLTPDFSRTKIPALYIQGHVHNTQGWAIRPAYPYQKDVAVKINQILTKGKDSLSGCPSMSLHDDDQFLEGSLVARQFAARQSQAIVRGLRRH